MARDIFADGGIGVVRETAKSFGGNLGVLADQAQEVKIFPGRLAGKIVESFGFYFGAEDYADFFVPALIDAIQFLGARVDQLFDDAAFLFEARRGQRAAFDGIENAEKMLAFAKNNLRSAHGLALLRVAYQI